MQQGSIILYTREGCHLCEDALAILTRHGCLVECVNIDHQPELLKAYNWDVPVVEIDGQVRFRGRVDEVLLRRLLLARREN